jgi:hypothetical protein
MGLGFSLLTPNTYHGTEYLRSSIPPEMWVNIEYQSTVYLFTRLNYYRIAVYWLLIPLAILGLAVRWRSPDITRIVLLAALRIVSFTTSRYMIFFLIAAVPLAASCLSGAGIRKWITPVVVGLAFAVGLCFHATVSQQEG